NCKQTILVGLTDEGRKFRPSDWAERMCGALCTFRNRRIYYSPLLRPAIRDGIKCVLIDEALLEKEPGIYHQIIDFAKTNRLQIISEQ
ncbi:MAG: acetyltransferase, partial [Gammaproteobacteria bacterium]